MMVVLAGAITSPIPAAPMIATATASGSFAYAGSGWCDVVGLDGGDRRAGGRDIGHESHAGDRDDAAPESVKTPRGTIMPWTVTGSWLS